MKVLLVIPTYLYDHQYPKFVSNSDFPVGFAYLASALKASGFDVFGLNPNNIPSYMSAYAMLSDMLATKLEEVMPEVIGIGGLCTDYCFLKDCITIIRHFSPRSKIILGGGIVTNDPEFIFSQIKPDYCIIGEAEEIIVQLVSLLSNEAGQPDVTDVRNIGYWKDGQPFFTKRDFTYTDINSRPFPDYEPFGIDFMLDDYSHAARYLYRYTRTDPRPMTIVTGRGCPFKCTFCVHQQGIKYRTRSMENIISEISILHERYQFNILIILDELFAVTKDRVRDFSLAVLKGKEELGWDFDWLFQTHACSSLDEETLQLAKKAGCYIFSYGIESASPAVIASMNKKNTPDQIASAIRVAEKSEIGFSGNFIFGDVAENLSTISETLDFFYSYCRDIHIFLAYIQPYPGSSLYNECLTRGIIKDKLDSYKNINRLYNMTSISTFLWNRWLNVMMPLAESFLWCKSAIAYYTKIDGESSSNPLVLGMGGDMFHVSAFCPFCGYDNTYREILVRQSVLPKQLFCKDRFRVFVRNFIHCFLEIFIPAFKKIRYIKKNNVISDASFLTGCRKCNKRYTVIINL